MILGENHVLREVIFSVELCKVVTTNLIGMEVSAGDSNDISVLPLESGMIGAVNVDRASQFLVLVVLVDYLVIVDGS